MKIPSLQWLKEKGIITEIEYDNTMKQIMEKKKHKASGDPNPGSSTGAAAAAAMPAPSLKRKIDVEDAAWVRSHALPKIFGCTITHIKTVYRTMWFTEYPGHGYRCRDYGYIMGYTRTSLECLNHVLHWAWDLHTRETGQECQWDFTPICD